MDVPSGIINHVYHASRFFEKTLGIICVAIFILHLILVLHIIPLSRFTIVADRYAYIASIGVFFFIAYLFNKATRLVKYKQISILLLTIYIAYLGIYTNQRAKVWHDNKSLKKEIFEAISKQPK
ncbi:hypothetical protein [Mucilaginibacter panaciglaebae]|uniref:Uncharacterized protein n=1 Tax=Mucilaginibacter panaciglaebae TaxID=502331 RepID=A0ABP7WIA2_9SPHI